MPSLPDFESNVGPPKGLPHFPQVSFVLGDTLTLSSGYNSPCFPDPV